MIRVENKFIKEDYASLSEYCRQHKKASYASLRLRKMPFEFDGFTIRNITVEEIEAEKLVLIDSTVDKLVSKDITAPAAKKALRTVLNPPPKRKRKKKGE